MDFVIDLLQKKIHAVSFKSIREDIIRFIPDDSVLDIWPANYFSDLIGNIKFK